MSTDRRDRILQGIDIRQAAGLEIGALAWPIVRKNEGNITYIDHTTTEELRRKYAHAPSVPLDQIVEVDAIWGNQTLAEAVNGRRFDYIIASHVVEHVPDLIGWFGELVDVLEPGGEIRLIVPDRRYTFDHMRTETRLADVLAAHAVRARVPQPQQVLSHVTQFAPLDLQEAWAGRRVQNPPARTQEVAGEWLKLARTVLAGQYHDVHCWVFTPHSWANLMIELAECGLMPCECSVWWDTAPATYEFILGMRVGNDVDSWRRMAEQARDDRVEAHQQSALDELQQRLVEAEERLQAETKRNNEDRERLGQKATSLQQEIERLGIQEEHLHAAIAALRGSTSWQITAPLRWAAQRIRRA